LKTLEIHIPKKFARYDRNYDLRRFPRCCFQSGMTCELCKKEPATDKKLCANCAEGVRRLVRVTKDLEERRDMEREFEYARARAAAAGH
jgi:hypothetical protein